MKKIICLALAVLFTISLCACSAKEQTVEPVDETEMINQMLSDLSQQKFKEIAEKCVLSDGSKVDEKDIKAIYDLIVQTGADPSLGFTVSEKVKSVNIGANAETSNNYSITALCGDKTVAFAVTIEKQQTGYFFTMIYTLGAVSTDSTTSAETEA